jgi:hypothetical protein
MMEGGPAAQTYAAKLEKAIEEIRADRLQASACPSADRAHDGHPCLPASSFRV